MKGIILTLFSFSTLIVALKAQDTIKAPGNQRKPTPAATAVQAENLPADPFQGVDTISSKFVNDLEALTSDLNKVNAVLKRGLDTLEIHEGLPVVNRMLENIRQNIYSAEYPASIRSLNAAKVILLQNAQKLEGWQKQLERYNDNLQKLRKEISGLFQRDKLADTTIVHLYSQQFTELEKKWNSLKKEFDLQNGNINLLMQRVAGAVITNSDLLDEVSFRSKSLKKKLLTKTDSYIWENGSASDKPFLDSLYKSPYYSWRLLRFYIMNHWQFILFLVSLALLFYFGTRYLVDNIEPEQRDVLLTPVKYLKRNAVLCAALLGFTFIPFLSFSPPAIYIELFWLGMLLVATRLAWPDWSEKYHHYWWGVVALFFLFGFDNILTRVSAGERWGILLLNAAAFFIGVKLYKEVRSEPSRYPVFQDEVIWLFMGANALAFFLNIFGRFTLTKIISNSAVVGLAHALSFFLLVEILLEALYLLLETNQKNKLAAYFQFSAIQAKFKKVLVVLGIFCWMLAFLWSLNILDSFIDMLVEFLKKPRSLGNMDFTLESIGIFLLVLWIAFAVSNLLRFFFGDKGPTIAGGSKSKMGSYVLLMRLGIISTGFLLAMGAAGIPMDKLAIIVGALGVGIGFGLQNIVNNLVSGIILAFEKPMDVGDVIEIGQNTGRVKEIGIRSSKISTFDGADIIVPNGDFISQRLTNWTHNNSYRRIDLTIGFAYGADLEGVQATIERVLEEEEGISKQPAPSVLWDQMGENAVVMRVLFWTHDFDNWVSLKSKVLKTIYKECEKADIAIAYPQQDLHIKSIAPEILSSFSGKNPPE